MQAVELQAAQFGNMVLHSTHEDFLVMYVWVRVHAAGCEVGLAVHSRMKREAWER